MEKIISRKNYQWDIAISLCQQDIVFAKKIVQAIHPGLKVFFYEDKKEEFISQSGPVAFANIFKVESRVVLILSRNAWNNSSDTAIERQAILERIAANNEEDSFLLVIPMVPGETPPWHPTAKIYATPDRFSVEELAHFIEFKVAEKGGSIQSFNMEDRHQHLVERMKVKKTIINFQHEEKAIQCAKEGMAALKDCFNKKSAFLSNSSIENISWVCFSEQVNASFFEFGDYSLECRFEMPDEIWNRLVTTQDFRVTFELFQTFGKDHTQKSVETEQRIFYYTPEFQGWALPHVYEPPTHSELHVLFRNRDNSQFYDLINPLPTPILVDTWFQQLLLKATHHIERYI